MSAAALTPHVRVLVVCDEAHASRFEDGVCSLEGVRYEMRAGAFPYRHSLSVYLLLSSPREGIFRGTVILSDVEELVTIRERQIRVAFDVENEPLPLVVDLAECDFPAPGKYIVQVRFTSQDGVEALKGEQPFRLLEQVE